ncbi:unnamed protein product (macronuclear) [Paramecium tetraurelia]|uniref:Uncharacterized protein n=1 Tax=Paramecium tetraurelia TaxID=5888 RepID=A0DF64_PARTE|nr:uncharacterized protein GSPATT00016494001 [Paramecium tetraurelia]CAK81681.1 unnamed protein product [Paramecium tetraurelia]|eukprot:XP_001449078.1 hypothetical protein (macronuclear) [Paramecium tetraurelia strain d4-2]
MGTQQPKAPQTKQITQFQIEIACLKVKGYVELNRDRRTNQALMREKALNEMLRSPSRVMVEEYQKFQQLVQDVRFLETCHIVLRYCEIVKDQSIRIFRCGGDHSKIADLMPYIESILFAADNLNLEQVMEFKDLMIYYFGPGFNDTSKLINVDQELRKLFKTPLPDAYEVNEYALKFAEKYGFSEEQLNASGHQFSSKILRPAQGGILVDQQGFGQQQFMPNPNQGFGDFGTQGGFGQPPIGGFGNPPQPGFGQPPVGGFGQPPLGGFGNPPQPGFGQPPVGGFGQPPVGGFGNPPQPGFGQPPQGGFGNPPQAGFGQPPIGGFGNPSQGGFGNPPQGGFGQSQPGGFGQSQPQGFGTQGDFGNSQGGFGQGTQGGFGNQPPQNGLYNQPNNQFGNPPTGGFGTTGGYGQINGSPNPYSCLNQGPQIMASQSMKVPQQYQNPSIPQQPQVQPAIQPQQTPGQQQSNIVNPNTQALDDLEARLRNLDKAL